ncbi:MAG: LSM domain-containing protein [Candidatus Hecatellaceae archaeon]|nr:MAG: RNA-binding protein [Candidatus Hecatellales archaeon]
MPEDMATKLLEESLGKIVLVKLKGGRSIRGKLQGFDQHMNLLLGEAEDVSSADKADKLGTIIVRGDNVILISPPKTG